MNINAINISIIGLIISGFSFALSFLTYWHNQKDKKLLRAPLIVVKDEFLNISEYRQYDFPNEMPYRPHPGKFSLDRRCFKKIETADGKTTEETVGAYLSVILDTTNENLFQPQSINNFVNFAYFDMLNMGYDCLSIYAESIEISYQNGAHIKLEPTEHNEIDISKKKNEHFCLGFTAMFSNDEYKIFDVDKLEKDPRILRWKFAHTQKGVLNTFVPNAIDLWSSMTFIIVTKNIHNEKYKQKMSMFFKNNTYYTNSVLLTDD